MNDDDGQTDRDRDRDTILPRRGDCGGLGDLRCDGHQMEGADDLPGD